MGTYAGARARLEGTGQAPAAPAAVLAGETDLLVDSLGALGHLFGLVG